MHKAREQGFSLIELLIVVAIILIIAAIAIPNFIRSRITANEASAVAALRTIDTACVNYANTYGVGYPASLATLGSSGVATSTSADLLDNVVAGGMKSGYTFTYTAGPSAGGMISTYSVTANPVTPGQTGVRYFFTDETFVIRFNATAQASASDSPIQ
ncbi:MAG TPA: prepilin-type N-terminal cleavage/methylation domain-containing protein [Patescibacteria group bacterium]|nr:prepilin-type N-terminal cleavage/methylation domain-containing protein [Patescibacteria group bacterium]